MSKRDHINDGITEPIRLRVGLDIPTIGQVLRDTVADFQVAKPGMIDTVVGGRQQLVLLAHEHGRSFQVSQVFASNSTGKTRSKFWTIDIALVPETPTSSVFTITTTSLLVNKGTGVSLAGAKMQDFKRQFMSAMVARAEAVKSADAQAWAPPGQAVSPPPQARTTAPWGPPRAPM